VVRPRNADAKLASAVGLVGAVLLSAVSFSGAASAQSPYAYCAVSRGVEGNYEDCSFATLADCREELKGLGGFCQLNPRYVPPPQLRDRTRAQEPAPGRRPPM